MAVDERPILRCILVTTWLLPPFGTLVCITYSLLYARIDPKGGFDQTPQRPLAMCLLENVNEDLMYI